MNRLGLLNPSELEGEPRALYDIFYKYTTNKYGNEYGPPNNARSILVTMDKEDRFIGPFGVLLHTPALGQHFMGIGSAVAEIPGLTPFNREIVIVAVGAKFDAAYELYAHKRLAERAGISKEQIDTILAGKRPESLDESGKAVYDVAHELLEVSGPLKKEEWERAVAVIGKEGATAVVHYVSFYSYVCMMLRGFDCQLPDLGRSESEPEQKL